MAKVIVLYKSVYGSSKKYAEWIAEALDCTAAEVAKVKIRDIADYDTVILGGGLYAGSISGASFIAKHFGALAGKNLIVFTAGLSQTADETVFKPAITKMFKPDMIKRIRFFHLRGGMDYTELNFLHKTMVKMFKKILLSKKDSLTADESDMLNSFCSSVDFADKNTITPLVDYVKSLPVD